MSYIIIKLIKISDTGKELPVILLDGTDEILEFEDLVLAKKECARFQINSDSGHIYKLMQTGVQN